MDDGSYFWIHTQLMNLQREKEFKKCLAEIL